ncbi:hypothetical protein DFA_09868 [Cavenderia fasciculata]|uniref:Uncharacterized protein n=1 Tax=Cavenderia fasciculata TaxID=261658 RepID=F4Q8M6_CACFS|nr:uncharacterized protein DFA_09868 [Cavenderia fasciculata]EGG15045.1 hypothetical protein DFA_09868 [Cavenderia fasciculata]|eukprot:XP_004351765.1 hypothetical protein DFA_09868 [Cavenderia fasciculata]
MKLIIFILISALTIGLVYGDSNLLIFDDYLANDFQDYSWGHYDRWSNNPIYRGSNSIKFSCINFNGLYFSRRTHLDKSKYEGFSFWVNPGNNYLSPGITLQLSNENEVGGPTLKLISKNQPWTSATGMSSLQPNSWVKAFVPFPNDGNTYSGLRIMSDTSQGSDVFFDYFQVEVVGSNNHPKEYPPSPYKPPPGAYGTQVLQPGAIYQAVDTQADPSLGGVLGGHSFWTSLAVPALNDQTQWSFNNDARLFVMSSGDLLLTGTFSGGGCWKWQANIEFAPWIGAQPYAKQELAPYAYVPEGPIDPATWRFYFLRPEESYWKGIGCNRNSMIQMTGLEYNMPAMVGYGANGKNGNLGLSVWMTYKAVNGMSVHPSNESPPIDINIDLIPLSSWDGQKHVKKEKK